jgi:hypothetical protein
VPTEEVRWISLQGEIACLDCLVAKNQPKGGLQRLLELSTMFNRCTLPGYDGASKLYYLPEGI